MISIIISSVKADMLNAVSENIRSTINVPFEIIAYDNSDGKKGLCEVYNLCADKAKYDILCFMHEDIIIKSTNWGNVLVDIFKKDPQIGLIGVIGGSYKPLSPSSWNGIGLDNTYANLIQSFKYKKKQPKLHYYNPNNTKIETVACIDGLFMCSTKKIFSEHRFDERTFKGFHVYDIDYALSVGQHYRVVVTYDILLNHLSEGKYNKEWMYDNIKLHEKWAAHLPVNIEGFSYQEQQYIEKLTFKNFIKQLIELGMPVTIAYKMLWKNNRFRLTFSTLFWKLHYYILKIRFKQAGRQLN